MLCSRFQALYNLPFTISFTILPASLLTGAKHFELNLAGTDCVVQLNAVNRLIYETSKQSKPPRPTKFHVIREGSINMAMTSAVERDQRDEIKMKRLIGNAGESRLGYILDEQQRRHSSAIAGALALSFIHSYSFNPLTSTVAIGVQL